VAQRKVLVRKVALDRLGDRFDAEFWATIDPSERFAEAWRLTEELWRFKGVGSR
jgi:hypothetical protein